MVNIGTVREHVLHQDLDGEIVVLDSRSGDYFNLNEVASRMWVLLTEHGTLSEVIGSLLKEFDIDEEPLKADLMAFIKNLVSSGLMDICEDAFPASE